MRKLSLCTLVLATLFTASCDEDPNDPVFIYQEGARLDLVGIWSGIEEITSAEDPGFNLGVGNERGYTFPVVLRLHVGRTFELTTVNFPTSFDDDFDRTCVGTWVPDVTSVHFFPESTCRALPLSRYSVGRVLPFGITLQASTADSFGQNNASIRVRLRLDRD
jgi:hypothetical protein